MAKPTNYLGWTDGDSSKIVAPPAPLLLSGYTRGESPTFQHFNYIIWLLDQWVQYLDQTANMTSFTVTAGQGLTANQVVYLSLGTGIDSGRTTGNAYLADSSLANNAVRGLWTGFVQSTVLSGTPVTVITSGILGGFTGLTKGSLYYLDPTNPGGLTTTVPTIFGQLIAAVGMAISTTQIEINNSLSAANIIVGGSTLRKSRLVTSVDIATSNDDVIRCDATTASFIETLPPIASCPGKTIFIKCIHTNTNTVTPKGTSSELIDGSNTYQPLSSYDCVSLFNNGTSWDVI